MKQDRLVTCDVCGLSYVTGLDTRTHNAKHAKFLALSDRYAEPRFGGDLWLYPQREEEKHAASDIIDGEGRTIEERLAALERIAYSWYCRAVLGCRKRAPHFDKYCALLGETVQELFSIDIAAAFTDRYGTSPGVIPRGFTDLPETGRNRERW
jgi:hypothetical protein